MSELLEDGERARAAAYFFETDRARWVMARGCLRVILARYVRREPREIRFRHNQHGKPILDGFDNDPTIDFSVSYSRSVGLYAITKGRRVGLDVEYIRQDISHEDVAGRFFSRLERNRLQSLPAESRNKAFFDCWTRKEAYIKGRGEGLSHPLEQFSVSIDPGEPVRLIDTPIHPADVDLWSLQEIHTAPGYAATIAVEGHDWNLACFDLHDG